MSNEPRKQSPSFFRREDDGSVRIRMRFEDPLPGLIEEAAGRTPLMVWIYRTLEEEARRQVEANRRRRPPLPAPRELEQHVG